MDSFLNSLRILYAQATVYNYNTPGRQGGIVYLDESNATDVIFTGDLHGRQGNFYDLCDMADLEHNPGRHLVFQELCHGGIVYANGSCASHQVVEDVARMVCQYPGRVHFVLGNHEMAEMSHFPIRKRGVLLNIAFARGLEFRYGPMGSQSVHKWMTDWFWSCPLGVRWKNDVLFTHSIPATCDVVPFDYTLFDRCLEEDDFGRSDPFYRLVWGRDYREVNAQTFANAMKVTSLITGHEPCMNLGFKRPNSIQIILDCCDDVAAFIHLTADMQTDPMTIRSAVHFL